MHEAERKRKRHASLRAVATIAIPTHAARGSADRTRATVRAAAPRSRPPRPAPTAPAASLAWKSARCAPASCPTDGPSGQGRGGPPAGARSQTNGCRRSRPGTSPHRSRSRPARSTGAWRPGSTAPAWRSTARPRRSPRRLVLLNRERDVGEGSDACFAIAEQKSAGAERAIPGCREVGMPGFTDD